MSKDCHNIHILQDESGYFSSDSLKQIQKCIAENSTDYKLHATFGCLLLTNQRYKEALLSFEKAYALEPCRDILHNIGCCYFRLGDIQKAKESFSNAITEARTEFISLNNLALMEWKLNRPENMQRIADLLFDTLVLDTESNTERIDGYDIAYLYFLLGDYKRSIEAIEKHSEHGFDNIIHSDLSYVFYKIYPERWRKNVEDDIEKRKACIKEIEDGLTDFSEEEKELYINTNREFVNKLQRELEEGVERPMPYIGGNVLSENCEKLGFYRIQL